LKKSNISTKKSLKILSRQH